MTPACISRLPRASTTRDLLAAVTVPRVRFTQVFRQAADSGVVTNAHRINAGRPPLLAAHPGRKDLPERRAGGRVFREQYSVWPAGREVPDGWRTSGFAGSKPDCLAHIDQVWTDMRPLSLRRWSQEHPDPT